MHYYVLILHETDYQIVQTQRVGFCIFFSSLFFFKGESFFKPKPLLVVFVVIVFKMFCLFLKGRENLFKITSGIVILFIQNSPCS